MRARVAPAARREAAAARGSFTIGESGKVAGGEGGKVGARQRGFYEGVGIEVFFGEDLEPAPEV